VGDVLCAADRKDVADGRLNHSLWLLHLWNPVWQHEKQQADRDGHAKYHLSLLQSQVKRISAASIRTFRDEDCALRRRIGAVVLRWNEVKRRSKLIPALCVVRAVADSIEADVGDDGANYIGEGRVNARDDKIDLQETQDSESQTPPWPKSLNILTSAPWNTDTPAAFMMP
jgi:hypothetical protein